MTNTQIKNLINTAITFEELEPLREYADKLRAKASKVDKIFNAMESKLKAEEQFNEAKEIKL